MKDRNGKRIRNKKGPADQRAEKPEGVAERRLFNRAARCLLCLGRKVITIITELKRKDRFVEKKRTIKRTGDVISYKKRVKYTETKTEERKCSCQG